MGNSASHDEIVDDDEDDVPIEEKVRNPIAEVVTCIPVVLCVQSRECASVSYLAMRVHLALIARDLRA